MQSTFDERNWLAWLVKVRILILTFLLGIQLAVAELTPTRLPLRLFLSTMLLWYTVSLFYALLLSVLAGTSFAGILAGPHRPDPGQPGSA